MTWGVWCTVSGGVTGSRATWAKSNGVRLEFATELEAAAEADICLARVSAVGPCRFTYTARTIGEAV